MKDSMKYITVDQDNEFTALCQQWIFYPEDMLGLAEDNNKPYVVIAHNKRTLVEDIYENKYYATFAEAQEKAERMNVFMQGISTAEV